ncbi:MAG: helix-turn-helix domain-containing protein [Cyanobacteriota bacterium]
MFRQVFIETQESRRITGKSLSDLSGISANHIAQFRRGNRDMTSEMLWQLVEAMDKISPGARVEFCQRLAGQSVADINQMNSEQLSSVLFAVANTLQSRRLSDRNNVPREELAAS